jgi:hypothetical protein
MATFESFAQKLSVQTSVALGPDGAPVLQEDELASCSYDQVAASIADNLHLGDGKLVLTTRWEEARGPCRRAARARLSALRLETGPADPARGDFSAGVSSGSAARSRIGRWA